MIFLCKKKEGMLLRECMHMYMHVGIYIMYACEIMIVWVL